MNILSNIKQKIKKYLSNVLFKRHNNGISLISYLGVNAFGFNNQKDTQKLKYGLYGEIDELTFFKKQFSKNDTFLDIGANMGFYTVLAAKFVNQVVAIEPIRKNVALIKLSLELQARDNWTIYQKLASDKEEEFHFLEVEQSGLSRLIKNNEEKARKHIELEYGKLETSIKKYTSMSVDALELTRLDLIKIDIEGFELKAIMGALRTLERCKPRLIMIEVVEEAMSLYGDSLDKLLSMLGSLGYQPHILVNNSLEQYTGQKIPNDNLFFSRI